MPIGRTTLQYGVFCALEAEPDLSNARLARALFVTAQTMHGILSNLEREGLVERRPDPDHGRTQPVALTLTGVRALSVAHHQCICEVECRLTAALNEVEAGKLTTTLMRCAEQSN